MTKMSAILQLVSALLNPSIDSLINIFNEQLKTALFLHMKSGYLSKEK